MTSSALTARALATAAVIGVGWQMFTMSHTLGALEANTGALIEMSRDQTVHLREMDRRMGSLEGQLKALVEALNRIAQK
jgi:hypothetical protein